MASLKLFLPLKSASNMILFNVENFDSSVNGLEMNDDKSMAEQYRTTQTAE